MQKNINVGAKNKVFKAGVPFVLPFLNICIFILNVERTPNYIIKYKHLSRNEVIADIHFIYHQIKIYIVLKNKERSYCKVL